VEAGGRAMPGRGRCRAAAVVAGAVLSAAVAGCVDSGNGVASECSFESTQDASAGVGDCVVFYDRGGDTHAAILGVDLSLVSATSEYVTVRVDEDQLVLPVGATEETHLGRISLRVGALSPDRVSIIVTRAP
jgi:hypothetical protein